MTEPLTPLELATISLLTTNAAKQINALGEAMALNMVDDLPGLETTAKKAAAFARDALNALISRLPEKKKVRR